MPMFEYYLAFQNFPEFQPHMSDKKKSFEMKLSL